jgi:hypothetical protein
METYTRFGKIVIYEFRFSLDHCHQSEIIIKGCVRFKDVIKVNDGFHKFSVRNEWIHVGYDDDNSFSLDENPVCPLWHINMHSCERTEKKRNAKSGKDLWNQSNYTHHIVV